MFPVLGNGASELEYPVLGNGGELRRQRAVLVRGIMERDQAIRDLCVWGQMLEARNGQLEAQLEGMAPLLRPGGFDQGAY